MVIDRFKALSFLPFSHSTAFVMLPSTGASGGLLTAWDPNSLQLSPTPLPSPP